MRWERREKFESEIAAFCTGCQFFLNSEVSCSEPLQGLYQKRNALDKSCPKRKEVPLETITVK